MEEMNVVEMTDVMERMVVAVERLERMAAEAQENVGRIVATVENEREVELLRRLEEAEAKIAALSAAGAPATAASGVGRKTLPAGMASLLAKQGVTLELGAGGVAVDAAAIDGALGSLSVEQRIAVKSELLRAGLLG